MPPKGGGGGGGRAKGVSADEKRKRMLQYFYETKSVYNLKDLEKDLPKAKGIVQQSVKDVLQLLQSEDLVDSDKIGSGQFFWSFPSKVRVKAEARLNQSRAALANIQEKKVVMDGKKREFDVANPQTPERTAKLQKLSDLKRQRLQVDSELAKFASVDPERVKEYSAGALVAVEAARRWTDAIDIAASAMKTLNNDQMPDGFYENYNLPEEFDSSTIKI